MKRIKIGNPTRTPFILIIMIMPILFVSCFLFSPQRQGTGALSISVSTVNRSKDFSPTIGDVTVASYRVTGQGPGGASFDPVIATSSPIEIDGLASGDWDITVEGMNNAVPQVILAEAVRTLSIAADKTTSAAFSLVPLEGSGTLALTVKWPDGAVDIDEIRGTYASADRLTAGTFDWDIPAGGTLLDGYRLYSDELQGLAAGSNAIVLSFYFGGSPAGPSLTECAIIYKGITTNGTAEIPADFSAPDSPTFSPPGSTYEYARTVTIESSSEDVDIYYTTDGNDPGILSAKYTNLVYIASNLTLKAVAVNSANLMSDVSSEQYRILETGSDNSLSKGTMLLRYGSRIYTLGGLDTARMPLSNVRSATVAADGSAGTLTSDAGLPEGIAYGSAIAAGNLVYIIGGETSTGLSSTIYFTLIKSDGTLGFGSPGRWDPNARGLPAPRSRAAAVLHDGWIYLIGGTTDTGATDTIIRARLYQDGQVGMWYPIPEKLPRKVRGASAAVLGDRLYIAGGRSGSEMVADVVSYGFNAYGALSDRRSEQSLPVPLYNSVLLADRDDLILAGGFQADGSSSTVYRYHSDSWSAETGLSADAEGPWAGRAAGSLWYLPKGFENQEGMAICAPQRLQALALASEIPEPVPGSGQVSSNTSIRMRVEPGTTLRYTTDGSTVTSSSPAYNLDLPPKASATLTMFRTRAFATDGESSPEVKRDYSIKSTGMFVMIAGIVPVHGVGTTSLDRYVMQEPTNDTATYPSGFQPTTVSCYRIQIASSDYYRLDWADHDVDTAYSARVSLSLVESDLVTIVPDRDGSPAAALTSGTSSPVHLYLQAGDYLLYLNDTESVPGRSFGIGLSRE